MVNSTIKMEVCMMDNGNKTKWKALANFTTSQGNLHMKEYGGMINLWEKVYSITNYLMYLTMVSIIIILMMSKNTGQSMKVNFTFIFRVVC